MATQDHTIITTQFIFSDEQKDLRELTPEELQSWALTTISREIDKFYSSTTYNFMLNNFLIADDHFKKYLERTNKLSSIEDSKEQYDKAALEFSFKVGDILSRMNPTLIIKEFDLEIRLELIKINSDVIKTILMRAYYRIKVGYDYYHKGVQHPFEDFVSNLFRINPKINSLYGRKKGHEPSSIDRHMRRISESMATDSLDPLFTQQRFFMTKRPKIT